MGDRAGELILIPRRSSDQRESGSMFMSRRSRIRAAHFLFVFVATIAFGTRAGAAQTSYSALVTARNPLAYLMLDETSGTTATDSSQSTSHPGTFGTGVTLGQPSAAAILNTAIKTNGTATPITIAGSSEFDNIGTGDFSVEMWFNTSNIATREDLFNHKGTSGSDLGIQLSSETADHLSIFHTSGFTISSTVPVTANTWHHLALTRVGATGAETLYLDGNVIGSATDLQTLTTNTGTMTIGNKTSGTPRIFTGSIDEFAFYNTALTPAQIQADIAAVPEPATLGLLATGSLALLARRRRCA
jgi:hypothetical protein